MEIANEFIVPATPSETWPLLTDIPQIAPCLPGAEVFPGEGGCYQATVTVQIGPIKARYSGSAAFTTLDETNLRMVLDATGRESAGRGSASATVGVSLSGEGEHHTRVRTTTQLRITGKPAQFGRAAIADVAEGVVGRFATNLAGLLDPSPDITSTAPVPDRRTARGATQEAHMEPDRHTEAVPVLRRSLPIAVAVTAAGAVLAGAVACRRHVREMSTPLRSR